MSTSATELFADETVTVHCVSVSEMDNRCYVITHRPDGAQFLVDAADDPEVLRALVSDAGCTAGDFAVLTTHAHWDHTRAIGAFSGSRLVAGADDAEAIEAERGVRIGERVGHGDTVRAGGLELSCVALRGHTPGSIAYVLTRPGATIVFSGDSLFPGGVGRTTTPEDFSSLLTDVTQRLFDVYPDATLVLPGHGEPTTLGAERPHLGEWAQRGW